MPHRPPRSAATPQLARLVLEAVAVWVGLMAVLFAAYEVVDQVWLDALPDERREAAQLFRGIAMSLTATVVTAVWMLWRRIPSLERSLDSTSAPTEPSEHSLAQWFLGLRWVALVVLAAVVAAGTLGGRHVAPGSILPLWEGVIFLLVVDVSLVLVGDAARSRPAVLLGQLVVDALLIAWLLHHAGGLANPFAAFYVFHAVIAGILLDARRARIAVAAIAGVVLVQTLVESTGWLPPACVKGLDHVCREPDPLHLAAAGVGLTTLSVGCALFTFTLVTALRRERDRLADARSDLLGEREKLQSILGCMADAVIFADTEGRVRLHNPAAATLWKHRPGAGEDLRVCHNPETWNQLLAKVAHPEGLEEHPILRVDGRSYEATYAPVRDAEDALQGVVMVARDVTERLEAQEWRMREERMAVVGQLAASVAHEINNPLGVVKLYTQHALKKVPPEEKLAEHLRTVLQNADQASKIVRDLLSYARQSPPERKRFELPSLFADVGRTLGCVAERAGVEVRLHVAEGSPVEVVGDPDQIKQILVNLGLNAIDAMRESGRGESLTLRAVREGPAAVALEVSDEGPGVAPDDHERVFSAFYTTKAEGTGLGLAVARDLARAHGGSLELRSTPGQGCTFVVHLPTGLPETLEAAE